MWSPKREPASTPRQRERARHEADALVVTGTPPDVHCDPSLMRVQYAPRWHLLSHCEQCSVRFGFIFNRRHHCRSCGRSMCDTHSSKRLVLLHYQYAEPERVCNACYRAYTEASRDYAEYLEQRLHSIFS